MKPGVRVRVVGPHATGAFGTVVERPEGQWNYPEAKGWVIVQLDGSSSYQAFTPTDLRKVKEKA